MKNQITLIGNIGNDPTITNFDNGGKVARFQLATSSQKNGNEIVEWHRLFAWGNTAQFIENFAKKGKQIAITGKIVNRTYLGKLGKLNRITEVEIRQVVGL